MAKNPYIVLGIHRGADMQDIKRAYRRAVKHSHPDMSCEKDGQRFKEIQDAYDILKDRYKRRACDAKLDSTESPQAPRRRRPDRRSFYPSPAAGIRSADPFDAPAWGSQRAADVYLEIRLSPAEARAGGDFPIRLPLVHPCPYCRGEFPWVMLCPDCRGTGRLRREENFSLHIPSGISDGTCITLTLDKSGALNGELHLLFRIDPRAG